MIRFLFRTAATILMLAATSLFIAGFAAVGFASFMLTWPLVWDSPTRRRVAAGIDLIGSIMRLASTFSIDINGRHAAQAVQAAMDIIPEDDAQ